MFKFEDNDDKVFCIKDSNVELSATFEILPKDLDTITIEWTRDGKAITNSEKFKVTKTKNAIQLAIQHVQRDDAGHYKLYAKTDSGETAEKDIELLVEDRSFGDNPPAFLRRLNDLAVKVGTRTRLLVEIRSATDVRVTWYRNDRRICENDRINFVNEGSFYCLEISSITLDDGGKWMCMAENLGGRNSCLATLNVLVPKAYKAPEFVEELRAILTEQGTVSLECKVVGVPTPILRWFKDSKEIKAGDVFALTANPDDLTSLGTYTCEAVNCMGKTYSSSKLHISGKTSRESSLQPAAAARNQGPPPIFTSELKSVRSKIGDAVTLGCQLMVPPWPKSVAWYNKDGKIEPSEKYKLIEDGLGSYIVEIKPTEFTDEGEWKFVVTSAEGTVSISTCAVHMEVPKNYRKPRFMENLKAILTDEGLVSFECKVVGFPTPLLRWFKDGHELKPGDVYQLTGTNSLGSYSCIARNCMGEASSSAVLTLEDIQNQLNENERIELQQKNQPPKFVRGLMSAETKINEEFRFAVQVKATSEPVFAWYRDDLPIDGANDRYDISSEKVGSCTLLIKCVEFSDQAEWKCVATNEFGHSASTCFLKLQIPRHFKKPRFLECLRAVLTEEGAVNLECKVIGVPQPTLRWFKDGVELKPGDIHRIISGKDGECSLGTYTCEARNCMGVVTSSATLLGYEENYKNIPKPPEPANILQRHLSLSTIHEERTSQMYDTPLGGDITVDEKGDVSFSFDGKEVSVSLYETPDLTEEEALQIVEMYADQISEHVTEQNIVELPPLRFVKETTQSGNLLMEAVVIDVSPDYFPPEDDMRTEADMEDISVVDHSLSEHLSESSSKRRRRKEESQVEEFFSLSQSKQTKPLSVLENYVVEEAHSDEEITETDLQTFESAKSSQKESESKKKPAVKSDDSMQEPPKLPPRKKPESRDEDSVYLQDISGEQGDGLKTKLKKQIDPKSVAANKATIEKVVRCVRIVKQHLTAVESEVVSQSTLMMSPAAADSSIGIIKSVLEPIGAIERKVDEYAGERSVESLVDNLLNDLKSLNNGLSIIEKCVEMDAEGRTLVQRTSVCVIESVGEQMLAFLESLKQVCLANVEGSLQNESLLIINDMQTGIHITEDTIKSQTLMQEASALEASQRVSESVAQMQHVPEVVPLEVVTTAELPKEANSFKLLCRYILRLQEVLETAQQSDVKRETVGEIQQPIAAIQSEIHAIEERISKNSLKDTLEEKISFKILDTVSPPLYELNKCLEAVTRSVAEGSKSPKILDSFVLPLQEIQNGLALIGHEIDSGFIGKESPVDTEDNHKMVRTIKQNVIYFESNVENVRERTSVTVYEALTQLKITMQALIERIAREPLTKGNLLTAQALKLPLEELNYCFRHIEERMATNSLRDLLDPLNSLRENAEVAEEKLRHLRVSAHAEELKRIKTLVDQCDAEIQLFDIIQLDYQERSNQQKLVEQQLSQHEQLISEFEQRTLAASEKCDVLACVQQNIVNIQEIIGLEQDKSFSEHLSTLTTLASPLRDLSRQIANIREEILVEHASDISRHECASLLKLAEPLKEIYQQLAVITRHSTLESAQVFSTPLHSNQDALKSLATPLAELRDKIAAIQHECVSLHEIQGEIEPAAISLKTAQPLEELRVRVDEIIHNIVEVAGGEEVSATLDDVSLMKSASENSEAVREEIKEVRSEKVEVKETQMSEVVTIVTQIEREIETVKIAIMQLTKPTKEVKAVDSELSAVQESIAQLSSDIRRTDDVVTAIEKAENSLAGKNTSDLILIKYNLASLKKILLVLRKTVWPAAEKAHECKAHVAGEVTEEKIETHEEERLEVIEELITCKSVARIEEEAQSAVKEVTIVEEIKESKATKVSVEEPLKTPTTQEIAALEPKELHATLMKEIENARAAIKKAPAATELQALEQQLTFALENITTIADNASALERAIEVIEIAEQTLSTQTSTQMVEIRDNLSSLKQILIILKATAKVQKVETAEMAKAQVADIQVVDSKEELQVRESQESIVNSEETSKPLESKEAKIAEEPLKITEEPQQLAQATQFSVEIFECLTKTREELENASEAIKKARRPTAELTATQGELNVALEKLAELPENQRNIEKVIESIVKAEASLVAKKTSDIVLVKGYLATLKQSLVVLSEKVKTQSSEVKDVEAKPQVAELSVVENSEELKIVESSENIAQEVVENEKKTEEVAAVVAEEKPQDKPKETDVAKEEEIKPVEVTELEKCLTKSKEEIEQTIESIKKVRRTTPEMQAIERQLSVTFENASELPKNEKQIAEILSSIEATETSILTRKTSDIAIVREHLAALKQSLVILRTVVIQERAKVTSVEAQPQQAQVEVIESKEELKIVEEKIDEKPAEKPQEPKVEEKAEEPLKITEKPEETKIAEEKSEDSKKVEEKPAEPIKLAEKPAEPKKVEEEPQKAEKKPEEPKKTEDQPQEPLKIEEPPKVEEKSIEPQKIEEKPTEAKKVEEKTEEKPEVSLKIEEKLEEPQKVEQRLEESQKVEQKLEEPQKVEEKPQEPQKVDDKPEKKPDEPQKVEEKPAESLKIEEPPKIEEKPAEQQPLIEDKPAEAKPLSTSQEQLLPEFEKCVVKTKDDIESATVSINKVRRTTPELEAAQKQLTLVLESISILPQNQQQIEKAIESIETAELSIATRRTSDIAVVKENLSNLKESLKILNDAVKAQKADVQEVSEQKSQIADLQIIETSEELKIIESNESIAEEFKKEEEKKKIETKEETKVVVVEEKVVEKVKVKQESKKEEEPKVEVTKEIDEADKAKVAIPEKSETKMAEGQPKVVEKKEAPLAEEVVTEVKTEEKVATQKEPEVKNVEEKLKIEEPPKEPKVEEKPKEIPDEPKAEEKPKEAQKEPQVEEKPKEPEAVKIQEEKQEVQVQKDDKVQEQEKPTEEVSIEFCIKKSKSDLQTAVASIKSARRPTSELQVAETDLKLVLESIENLPNDENKIEKAIESIEKAEASLVAKKTSDIVLVKENLKTLKQSLVLLKTTVQAQKLHVTEVAKPQKQLPDLSIIEAAEELRIIESNESIAEVEKTEVLEEKKKKQEELKVVEAKESTVIEELKTEKIETSKVEDKPAPKESQTAKVEDKPEPKEPEAANVEDKPAPKEPETKKVEDKPPSKEPETPKVDEKPKEEEKPKESPEETVKEAEPEKSKVEEQKSPKEEKPQPEPKSEEKPKEEPPKEEKIAETLAKEEVSVEFCIKKSKSDLENAVASIKSARRPTSELQATETDLKLTLEAIDSLPNDKKKIERAIESIEKAEASLTAKKTKDIVLVKENLQALKQSLVLLKTTVQTQKPQVTEVTKAETKIADLAIIEPSEDLKIVESNEDISTPTQEEPAKFIKPLELPIEDAQSKSPTEECLEKSKSQMETAVEAIKKTRRPTTELQAVERQISETLDHIAELPTDEKKIEKVLESIQSAEASLTAKKTTEMVQIKEKLSTLKESLTELKTTIAPQEVKVEGVPQPEKKLAELPVSEELKIVESNEDLALKEKQPSEIVLSLSKSREEIENVMFSIKKCRHPPTEVSAVEKTLTPTYEQLFELPKDEKTLEKAIESIENAEIALITRGASDLLAIKENLQTLKFSLVKVMSFVNPEKAEALMIELQKPQKATVEVQETADLKIVETEEAQKVIEPKEPQELPKIETNINKLEAQIETAVGAIKKSPRPTPEVQAVEKEFSFTIEHIKELNSDKQQIEKVIELIETAESSIVAKKTSDMVAIKENLALVKETLNVLKVTAKSKPVEVLDVKKEQPQQAVLEESKKEEEAKKPEQPKEPEKLKDEKKAEIKAEEPKKEVEEIKPKEPKKDESKKPEIKVDEPKKEETKPEQPKKEEIKPEEPKKEEEQKKHEEPKKVEQPPKVPDVPLNENVKKLKADIDNTIESIKKARRPTTEMQAMEKELTFTNEQVNNLPSDEQKLSKVIELIETTEASLAAKRTSDMVLVKYSLSDLKQSLKKMKEGEAKVVEVETPEIQKAQVEEEKPKEELKIIEEPPKVEEKPKEPEKLTRELKSLKLDIDSSIQSIKKARKPTSEMEAVEKVLSTACEHVTAFSTNDTEIQKAIESIVAAKNSLVARRTSDIILVKCNLTELREKLVVIQNKLRPQEAKVEDVSEAPKKAVVEEIKPEVKEKVEEPKVAEKKAEEPKAAEKKVEETKADEKKVEEPKAVEKKEEPKEEKPKAEDKKPEEPKAEVEKPKESKVEQKKVEPEEKEKPKEEPAKPVEKPKVELPKELKGLKIEITSSIDSIKKARRPTTEVEAVQKVLSVATENLVEFSSNESEIQKAIESIAAAESSLVARRTSDMVQVKSNLNTLKEKLVVIQNKLKPQEIEVKDVKETPQQAAADEIKPKEEKKVEEEKIKKAEEEKPKEEIKKVEEEKPKEEPKKVEEKPKDKPEKVEEKPKEEPKKVEDKPKGEPMKVEEKPEPKKETPPKPEEKLSPELTKLKSEITTTIESIKKARRPTAEMEAIQKELNVVLEQAKEIPENQQKLEKLFTSIEGAEASLSAKRTTDIVIVKDCLKSLKSTLASFKVQQQESKVEELPQPQKAETPQDEQKKAVEEPKKVIEEPKKAVEEPKKVEDEPQKVAAEEKPKEAVEEAKKVEEKPAETKPAVPETKTVIKLRRQIESTSATIKKVRRPTPELQNADAELTIVLTKLPEFENDVEHVEKVINVISSAEDSVITKKTSDVTAVKESFVLLKRTLTELRDSKKKTTTVVEEVTKKEEKEEKKVESVKEEKAEEKPKEEAKAEEKPKEKAKTEEESKVEEVKKPEEVEKPVKVEEPKPEPTVTIKLTEKAKKLKSVIENVTESIKRARRPTPEVQALEKTLSASLDIKILVEIPENVEKCSKLVKEIETCESSLVTKKTSDMVLIKNNLSSLKETVVAFRTALLPLEEKKLPEAPKVEEKPAEAPKEEEKKIDEKPKSAENQQELTISFEEKDLMAQYIVAIKQEVDEVLATLKKARRPSTELQTLHETLIDLKPKVNDLTKDKAYFETVLNVVGKAKAALLTKRTMELILLREKVTSLENSLILLKSTIVTEINGDLVAVKEPKSKEKEEEEEKKSRAEEAQKKQEEIRRKEEELKIQEEEFKRKEEELKQLEEMRRIEEEDRRKMKEEEELQKRKAKEEEEAERERAKKAKEAASEPERPPRRRRAVDDSESTDSEAPPVAERRKNRQPEPESEPVKPARRRRAEEIKEEEEPSVQSRTPEGGRRRRMPTFIARLKNRSAAENSILKLTCAVTEQDCQVKWTKDGQLLRNSEKHLIENSNGVMSLEIKNACAQDAGEYTCFVSNGGGEIETSAFVTIFGEEVQPHSTVFTKNLKGESNSILLFRFLFKRVSRAQKNKITRFLG